MARSPHPLDGSDASQEVRDNPDVERVIFPANRVDSWSMGSPVVAIVKVTWLPPPSRIAWLVVDLALPHARCSPHSCWSRRCARFAPTMALIAGVSLSRRQRHQHVPGRRQRDRDRACAMRRNRPRRTAGCPSPPRRWSWFSRSPTSRCSSISCSPAGHRRLLQRIGISAGAGIRRRRRRIRAGHRPRRDATVEPTSSNRSRSSHEPTPSSRVRVRRGTRRWRRSPASAVVVGSRRIGDQRSATGRGARQPRRTTITLTFSEPVEISLGAIRLFDGTGTSIDVSAARHPDGDDLVVEVDLPPLDERVVRRRLAGGLGRLASGACRVHVPGRTGVQPGVGSARSDHQQQPHRQDREHRIDRSAVRW